MEDNTIREANGPDQIGQSNHFNKFSFSSERDGKLLKSFE